MQEFFHGKFFKVLLVVVALLIGFIIYAASTGGLSTFPSQLVSIVSSPFQQLSSNISGAATEFFEKFVNMDAYYEENKELREQIAELEEQLADYKDIKEENEQLKESMNIKDDIPEVKEMVTASVIARDPSERFGGFTIDKGSAHGISQNDVVITAEGLVGRVYEVSLNTAKVVTILSPEVKVGAIVSPSGETGVVTGEILLAEDGTCKIMYLDRSTTVEAGDLVMTSGEGGIYPSGIIIGRVSEVQTESHGITSYAIIEPLVDVNSTKNVFVITDFFGKENSSSVPDGAED